MRDGYQVFDAHSHIGEWGSWEMKGNEVEPFNREFTSKEDLKKYMEKYGVDRQIVMPHYHPDLSITFDLNQLAAEMSELDGVYAGVFFEPSHPEKTREALEIALDNPGVKVLKTSADAWERGNYDPSTWTGEMREVMEELITAAVENDLVFQFHTGSDASDPRNAFKMADEHPDVTYHLVHMGNSAGGHFALLPRLIERLDTHNIYVDTSWSKGFAPRWFVRKLKEHGALDRMMFATDEPWSDFPSEYHKITGLTEEIDLTDEELQMILYDNASELYE